MMSSGIYIHIPFCNKKCDYCDYYSTEVKKRTIPSLFVQMLIKEIELTAANMNGVWEFDSIYIGGGSPALIKIHDVEKILTTLKDLFSFSQNPEITIELNPGENSANYINELRNLGINRVSLGFQSLDAEKLRLLTRNHNPNDCYDLFKYSQNAGFDNINIDMLYNIPNQTINDWLSNLELILGMAPDHITIISLSAIKGTIFHSNIRNNFFSFPDSIIEEKMYTEGSQLLRNSDFKHYEISSFTKKNKESIHNLNYWKRNPYLAFGPSAHGFDGKMRYWNFSSTDKYIEHLLKNILPIEDSEILSNKNIKNELFINGFRTKLGVELSLIKNRTDLIKKWNNYLSIKDKIILLKPEFYHLSDDIVSEFII